MQLAIGNPPDKALAVYDAGFYCHFISKIHQGAYSTDAFTNQLHEYFITVRCEDNNDNNSLLDRWNEPANARLADASNVKTEFSIKTMTAFGEANIFKPICTPGTFTVPQPNTNGIDGAEISASRTPGVSEPSPNLREIGCFHPDDSKYRYGSIETIPRLDLWTQHKSIDAPDSAAGDVKVTFHTYYLVNDPIRIWDASEQEAVFTVEYCKDVLAIRPDHQFCQGVTADMGPWDADSPFR